MGLCVSASLELSVLFHCVVLRLLHKLFLGNFCKCVCYLWIRKAMQLRVDFETLKVLRIVSITVFFHLSFVSSWGHQRLLWVQDRSALSGIEMYVEIAFRKQLVIRFMRISDQCSWQQNNSAAICTSISVQLQLRERDVLKISTYRVKPGHALCSQHEIIFSVVCTILIHL